MSQQTASSFSEQIARNGRAIIYTVLVAILFSVALFGYLGISGSQPRLLIIAATLLFVFIVDAVMLGQLARGKHNLAMTIVSLNFLASLTLTTVFIAGLGIITSSALLLTSVIFSVLAVSPRYSIAFIVTGILASVGIFTLDNFLLIERLPIPPQLQTYIPYMVTLIGAGFLVHIIREFNSFSLRVKVALGILFTGGIAVTALTAYGVNRAQEMLYALSDKYEGSITTQVESQISTALQRESQSVDNLFSETENNLKILADYRASLEEKSAVLGAGAYWNAAEQVYALPGGQFGTASNARSSIFIPRQYNVTEAMLADLNTSAYLDFSAPGFLTENPQVTAVYYISKNGATTYYPNINLAQSLPPDFTPLNQLFYTNAAPQNNPNREPRWTQAYNDPAGAGLVVTLSIPVYAGKQFLGVMGADLKLSQITENIASIHIGETGYAFMVDDAGRIIAMTPKGYEMFGLQPENVPLGQSPQQTILNRGSADLQEVSNRVTSGESSQAQFQVDGQNFYVFFMPIPSTGYRLAAFAPAIELQRAMLENRRAAEDERNKSIQSMFGLLFALFIGGLAVSLGVGQIISAPLVKLTHAVEQIAAGDLSARVAASSQDETGALALSFNLMADSLSNTLEELEGRVSERTQKMEEASANNLRRAAQFEAVARVARAISSTQTLEALFSQITESISTEFHFYHVGVFLTDTRREYAILAAANSEGGKRMLRRNHRLQVGGAGIVGYVTHMGQARVALDVGQDAAYFNNPDLPDTHSEIALPLRAGADIIGALDVQSAEINAFSQEDVNILSILADQVSIAIQNARSYQQSVEALAQAEKASYQASGQEWRKFLEQQSFSGYVFDGAQLRALTQADKISPRQYSIPLVIRGARIGAIRLNALDPEREWTDEEVALMQAAADRAALALENARLLRDSQKRAAKERTIGEVSAKISSSTELETILRTAISELGNALPGVNIAVQISDTPKR